MSDPETEVARLDERAKSQERRIASLENNQRWGILAILSLFLEAASEWIQKGGQ